MKPHVAEAVEEQLHRAPARLPPGVRLLLDLARGGKCGQHEPDELAARSAQEQGEWHEDRASSDAFLDLAYALRNLSGDGASNELCAGALAEAWRAEYPFRRVKDGDPLEVLVPHPDDARAARALDRARALPRPPVALARLGRVVGELERGRPPGKTPKEPFNRQLALALVAEAKMLIDALPTNEKGALNTFKWEDWARLRQAREWVLSSPKTYWRELSWTAVMAGLYQSAADKEWKLARDRLNAAEELGAGPVFGVQVEGYEELERRLALAQRRVDAADAADVALRYVASYNEAAKSLADWRESLKETEERHTRAPGRQNWVEMERISTEKILELEVLFPGEIVD